MTIAGPIRYTAPPDTTPTPSRAIEWTGYIKLVNGVIAAGIKPPDRFTALLEHYGNHLEAVLIGDGHTMHDRIVETLINLGDVTPLLAGALLERDTHAGALAAELLEEIRPHILCELREIYAASAAPNYNRLRAQFDEAATLFTDCADLIDPRAESAALLDAPPKTVQAWRDSEKHARTLENLIEPLSCAAELLRDISQPSAIGGDRNAFTLPLCADIGGLHRRAAWAAWHDRREEAPPGPLTLSSLAPPPPEPPPSRGGRWTRPWALDAEIRAHPDPPSLQLFETLAPFAVKAVTPAGGTTDNPRRQVLAVYDPEDEAVRPKAGRAAMRWLRRRHPTTDASDILRGGVLDVED